MRRVWHFGIALLVVGGLSACGDDGIVSKAGSPDTDSGSVSTADGATGDDTATGSETTTGDDVAQCQDEDGDGYGDGAGCLGTDCDDADATRFPGAPETCGDGIDQDCSGADEECSACADEDGDGYGDGKACKGTDCDDNDKARNPGASEVCGNGKDEDCNGQDLACPETCTDGDKDGYGDGPDCIDTDCDDTDSDVHPGAAEVCGNGDDEDCDGQDAECPPDCEDADKDGYGKGADCLGTDCDDGNADVHPGATELCGNGKDDDCAGGDEVCPTQCKDNDQDGYGEGPECDGPDCNDFDPKVYPGATDTCGDGIDQDCDEVDAKCPEECVDGDKDGFGVGATCEVKDCDDTDATMYPGAEEICGNGKDEDCDGQDPACVECKDGDGDGWGEGAPCKGPDCNDNDPAVNPGAKEVCGNGKDDDCNGGDEQCPTDCVDADSDGFGVGPDCTDPKDCDDTDATVNPDATEVCGNGKDDDCDGKDDTCPQAACTSDKDCGLEQLCDHGTGECRYAKVWEWWAPTIYQDIDSDHVGHDFFVPLNFDGDETVLNNGQHKDNPAKPAVVYYSFVKTSTHWYLGYYLYYPWRWSSFGGLGTQYENAMRGVLLVVEQNGSTYGKLVLMVTTNEDTFRPYRLASTTLTGGSDDGDIRFDPSGHHPIVYVHTGDHDVFGDAYLWNNVSTWEIGGFPGDDGVVYTWGNVADIPEDGGGKAMYELLANNDALWPKRFKTGGGTNMFSAFGQWASNDPHARSLAPWRLNDVNTTRPAGEFLFDPADFVRYLFSGGWGLFSFEYTYNPYAVRVDVDDLYLWGDSATADPFNGESDPYFTIYMRDGAGKEYKALDIFYGLQKNWHGVDIPENDYPLDMHKELGRYFFYGLEHPDHDLFGVDLKDDDGGVTGADWLMDPKKTYYTSQTGTKLLDWVISNAYFTITKP